MEKKTYEEPTVTKVEFDFADQIAASGCGADEYTGIYWPLES